MVEVYALDCEMIGGYNTSMLARVTIVNRVGQVVMDAYVKPTGPVYDYRTCFSGVTENTLRNGLDKYLVRSKVANILRGNILIGHSLHFDLKALELSHPEKAQRDLARNPLFMLRGQPVALKTLAELNLGRPIQNGHHDSKEDARACMDLYLKFWKEN